MQIETARLFLRPFVESDAEAASYNSRQPVVAHFMSDMVLETCDSAREWIEWIASVLNVHEPCQVLAIERKADAKLIGIIGIAPKEAIGNELEILFAVADEYQNNGYATEAAKAIVWWTFEKAGQDVISAIVKPDNKASRRVIDKLGFVYGDTRVLPYDGADCVFDYFRLYHTDYLPGVQWEPGALYRPESMDRFFDNRAEGYNEHMLSGGGTENYKKLGEFFPHTQGAIEILDIGCGTGIELDYIWTNAPEAHVTCVDMSRGMLDLLLKNHPANHDRITVVEASYTEWQYPAETFDLAVSSMTLHHLWPDEKTEVYRKILTSLKPDGHYIENDFIVDAILAEQYRRRYNTITAQLPDNIKAGEYHIDIPCTLEVQKKLMKDAGFRTVEVLYDNINPRGSAAILRAGK